jgi:tetratricopeptide (TPR) repeat protein
MTHHRLIPLSRLIMSGCALTILTSCVQTLQKSSSEPRTTANNTNHVSLGNQLARDGLLRDAIDSYKEALKKEPDNILAHRNLGIVLVKAGDFVNASLHLEKSISSFQDDFDTNFYLAEAYRAVDKYAEAIFRYKFALNQKKDEVRALKSLAWSYYKTRFYSESLAISQRLLKLAASDEQVPVIVARVLLKLRREDEALRIIRKASAKASKSAQVIYLTVEAEALHSKGRLSDSLIMYKKALKEQPLLAGALIGAGKVLFEQSKPAEASEFLERAVRVKPKILETYYYLGKSLEKSNPQKALKYLAHFKKNGSTDPEFVDLIIDTKKRIASLQSMTSLNISEP